MVKTETSNEEAPETPPLEDWEARLVEHGKKERVRKEVETEIVAYLDRVEAKIRDDILETLCDHPSPGRSNSSPVVSITAEQET